jgi:hypothetical protein
MCPYCKILKRLKNVKKNVSKGKITPTRATQSCLDIASAFIKFDENKKDFEREFKKCIRTIKKEGKRIKNEYSVREQNKTN